VTDLRYGALKARSAELRRRGLERDLARLVIVRPRRGDGCGGLESLREAVLHADKTGDRLQTVATVDWTIGIFLRLGRTKPTAVVAGSSSTGRSRC